MTKKDTQQEQLMKLIQEEDKRQQQIENIEKKEEIKEVRKFTEDEAKSFLGKELSLYQRQKKFKSKTNLLKF